MTNRPRRMSAHSHQTRAMVTFLLSPNTLARLLHQRGERTGRLGQVRRALAELRDGTLEVVELLLAFDGALEEMALFCGHLIQQLVRLLVADAARGDAGRVRQRRADLRFLEQR